MAQCAPGMPSAEMMASELADSGVPCGTLNSEVLTCKHGGAWGPAHGPSSSTASCKPIPTMALQAGILSPHFTGRRLKAPPGGASSEPSRCKREGGASRVCREFRGQVGKQNGRRVGIVFCKLHSCSCLGWKKTSCRHRCQKWPVTCQAKVCLIESLPW